MNCNRSLISILLLFLILGCQDLVYKKEITYGYYLIGVDTSDAISLCYEVNDGGFLQVTGPTIDRVGFNKKIIAVKSLNNSDISEKNGKFQYHIIPLLENFNKNWVDTLKIGPLTKLELHKKMEELDAGSVDFNI